MEFVVIVLGVILLRHAGTVAAVQRDGWFDRWLAAVRSSFADGRWPWLVLMAAILLPSMIVLLIDNLLDERWYGLSWFVFNLLIFLYALGRGDLDGQIEACLTDLERDDMQAAYHHAAAFNINHHEGLADSRAALHREMLVSISYGYFERYFAVIFWYAVLGAGGALLYRLSLLYRDRSLEYQWQHSVAERCLRLLDWLPLRLSGLTLSIMGNFAHCFDLWLTQLFNREKSSVEMMGLYVSSALDIQLDEEEDAAFFAKEVRSLRRLLNRALIGLGVFLSLVVLMT